MGEELLDVPQKDRDSIQTMENAKKIPADQVGFNSEIMNRVMDQISKDDERLSGEEIQFHNELEERAIKETTKPEFELISNLVKKWNDKYFSGKPFLDTIKVVTEYIEFRDSEYIYQGDAKYLSHHIAQNNLLPDKKVMIIYRDRGVGGQELSIKSEIFQQIVAELFQTTTAILYDNEHDIMDRYDKASISCGNYAEQTTFQLSQSEKIQEIKESRKKIRETE